MAALFASSIQSAFTHESETSLVLCGILVKVLGFVVCLQGVRALKYLGLLDNDRLDM